MTYRRIVEAGQDVADAVAALQAQQVKPSTRRPGCFDSDSLCRFQVQMSGMGYLEAQIVESIYGYSLRYASGLQDFGLIISARSGQTDGTLEGTIAAAKKWQAVDPTRRYVTRTVKETATP